MAKVRTNIEIEDSYVNTVMDRYGVRTKTEAVDLALRHPIWKPQRVSTAGVNELASRPADSSTVSSLPSPGGAMRVCWHRTVIYSG